MKLGGRIDRHIAETILKSGKSGGKSLVQLVESGFIHPDYAMKLTKLIKAI